MNLNTMILKKISIENLKKKNPNISNHLGVKFILIFISRTIKRFLVQKMHVPFGPGVTKKERDHTTTRPL